jgi:hypothetical protein
MELAVGIPTGCQHMYEKWFCVNEFSLVSVDAC